MTGQRILLIIGGGIAAYKCLDLIRRLRERGHTVRVVMTAAAQQFVTPLAAGAISSGRVFTGLFDLDDEREIGHIRLARDTDMIVVAPATADLLAKMAGGHANDLATAILLATSKPVLAAPAMNPRMWLHPATARNVRQLKSDGVAFVGPETGEMAEHGEAGPGRLAEVPELVAAIEAALNRSQLRPSQILSGRHVLITAGPTHEPIDPIRYIANRSSGKQGYALAEAAVAAGANVTLISGPVALPPVSGATVVPVRTAAEMLDRVDAALPADIAIFAAAVADWRVAEPGSRKIKKSASQDPPALALTLNTDILRTVARRRQNRPNLVIGFAAETDDVLAHAIAKRKAKGCDWIVANDVSDATGVMGGDRNTVHLITDDGAESWPEMTKADVAERIISRAAEALRLLRSAAE